MLEALTVRPRICQPIRSGPLGQWIDDFVAVLAARGYVRSVIRRHVRAAVIFSEWLEQQRVAFTQIDEPLVTRFVNGRARWRAPSRRNGQMSAVASGVRSWPRIYGPAVLRLATPRSNHRLRPIGGSSCSRSISPTCTA